MIIYYFDIFRARLGPLYARWKPIVGEKTWALLQESGAKLG